MKQKLETNYSRAWQRYTESQQFKDNIRRLSQAGIGHPYRENILRTAFDAGWNASGIKVETIQS